MSVLMELSIFPTDKGESVSEYVCEVIKMIREHKLNYQTTAMGTIIETENIDEALAIIKEANEILLGKNCNRIYCVAKFDIRIGKTNRLKGKVNSIKEKIGDINC